MSESNRERLGTGISPMRWDEIIRTTSLHDYKCDDMISSEKVCVITGTEPIRLAEMGYGRHHGIFSIGMQLWLVCICLNLV